MDYLLYAFLSHLPYIEEEVRTINNREEVCLVIPTKTNQIKRGKGGNWLMIMRLAAREPNARMITHDVQLTYLNQKDLDMSYLTGIHERTMRMGRVYAHDRTPSKKIDRTNHTQDIECRGAVILSDIPKSLIFRNDENDKRYVQNLIFRDPSNDTYIYVGSICIDDVPSHDIKTEQYTGKKYVDTIFRKLKTLDTYMNTHQLIVAKDDGSEIEIGKFKEFKKDGAVVVEAQEEHTTTVNPRPQPESIGGIRF